MTRPSSRLPVSIKTFFGVGQIAEGVKSTGFTTFLLFYYDSVLGLPFRVAMTSYTDNGTSFVIGIALLAFFTLLPPLLQILGAYPAPESPACLGILIGCTAIAVFGATAGAVDAGSTIADVADEHELRTGRRQGGIFFAALAFAALAERRANSSLADG